ncbi:MAG TPA: ribosome-associated translation inhibitor RaiA [Candidatus Paceibacterota bacterium]|nr:ribosome-associated translation inhibitor RaiA [Candidatus Paceibacterota bacterium]
MHIHVRKAVDFTPSLGTYIDTKLSALAKFIKPFDENDTAEISLEIVRTTKRHRKGDVFLVAADLKLPRRILRAEAYAEDVRTAIDQAKDMLRLEIKKYKTKREESRRAPRK